MSIIYIPKGRAREYSPYAANLYLGCNHGCKYCYAPAMNFKKRIRYLNPLPRRNLLREFENDCIKGISGDKQVLFCFMSDPYNAKETTLKLTRECLKTALIFNIKIAILTKSHTVLKDIDILKKFKNKIQVGFTLTFDNNVDSLNWEGGASLPDERLYALETLKANNIKTWASFEPVIYPEQSINMINKSIKYVDHYRIGKLNNYMGLDKKINWNDFLKKAIGILRKNNKSFYVKADLRKAAPDVELFDDEILMDGYCL